MSAIKDFNKFADDLCTRLQSIVREHVDVASERNAAPEARSTSYRCYLDLVFSALPTRPGKLLLRRFDKLIEALPAAAPSIYALKVELVTLAEAAQSEKDSLKAAKAKRAADRKAYVLSVTKHGAKLKGLSRAAFDTLNVGLSAVRAAYEKRALKYAGECIESARNSFKEIVGRAQWPRTAPWIKIVVGDAKAPSGYRVCEDMILRFIASYRRAAHAEVDSFVVKLAHKIGKPVTSVKILGSLWEQSFLTVVTEDGETQKWTTRCILNCSVLGKLFSQWPTRRAR